MNLFKSAAAWVQEKANNTISTVTNQSFYSQQQIVTVNDRQLRIVKQLGEGGYSFVYAVIDNLTNETFALKRILTADTESRALADKEIMVMKKLNGDPHIIKYYGACKRELENRSTEYFILMENCSGGTLIDKMKQRQSSGRGPFPEKVVCDIFTQIAKGVAHMHSQTPPIAHRDLKIENVLISDSGVYKLCDFGSAVTRAKAYLTKEEISMEEEQIQKYSTSMYRAPEMVDLYKKEVVNEKVDIWALGCILFCLAFSTHPFQEGGNLGILSASYQLPETHTYSKYLLALIKRLLTVNSKQRPDIQNVLNLCQHWNDALNGNTTSPLPKTLVSKSSNSKSTDEKKSKKEEEGEGSEEEAEEKEKPKKIVKKKIVKASTSTSTGTGTTTTTEKKIVKKVKEKSVSVNKPNNPNDNNNNNVVDDDDWNPFSPSNSSNSNNNNQPSSSPSANDSRNNSSTNDNKNKKLPADLAHVSVTTNAYGLREANIFDVAAFTESPKLNENPNPPSAPSSPNSNKTNKKESDDSSFNNNEDDDWAAFNTGDKNNNVNKKSNDSQSKNEESEVIDPFASTLPQTEDPFASNNNNNVTNSNSNITTGFDFNWDTSQAKVFEDNSNSNSSKEENVKPKKKIVKSKTAGAVKQKKKSQQLDEDHS